MNAKIKISTITAAAALLLAACTTDETVEFGIDRDTLQVGAAGGVHQIRVSSDTEWTASSDNPWITISPANGRGSGDARIIIDSALTTETRSGLVTIVQQNAEHTRRRINIEQQGFEFAITVEDGDRSVDIDNYAGYDSRYFELVVTSNVDFEVEIPDNAATWLSLDRDKSGKLNLNRGRRPRTQRLRFNWGINSRPEQRISEIKFRPSDVDETLISRNDAISVTQKAAEKIEENTRQGDSMALLGIQRSLGVWAGEWDSSLPMDEWEGVTLWQDNDEDRPADVEPGRVRAARFYLFGTKDSVIPYEIQYLTACEELDFFSNVNSFLYSFEDTGEYLAMLGGENSKLKRLYLDAMGYTDLPESFGKLQNLEYLSLMFNNFQKIPNVINGTNFPKLHALVMNGNRRNEIVDLGTTVYSNYGGLVDEGREGGENALARIFREFPKLDTLVLGINYIHGEIPNYEGSEYDTDEYRWRGTEVEDRAFTDSLPQKLIDGIELNGVNRTIPKVMPNLKWFTINSNRFTGELPLWLLYHPYLDNWVPFQLVFVQEGYTVDGRAAGFTNEPVNFEYYYDFYEGYKTRPSDDFIDDDDNTPAGGSGYVLLPDTSGAGLDGAIRLKKWKGLMPDGRPVTK